VVPSIDGGLALKRAIGSSLARLHRMSGEERQSVERDLASELAPDPNVVQVFEMLRDNLGDLRAFAAAAMRQL